MPVKLYTETDLLAFRAATIIHGQVDRWYFLLPFSGPH